VLRRATRADGPEIAVLFRRSFGTPTFLPTLHSPAEDREHFTRMAAEQEVWVCAYGFGNEERRPDTLYEWRP
jgi:hypothetical protein